MVWVSVLIAAVVLWAIYDNDKDLRELKRKLDLNESVQKAREDAFRKSIVDHAKVIKNEIQELEIKLMKQRLEIKVMHYQGKLKPKVKENDLW